MSYNVAKDSDKQCVRVEHEGDLTPDELKAARDLIKSHLEVNKWRKVLADIRNTNPSLNCFDIYEFIGSHEDVYPRGTRIAVLADPENRPDLISYAENVTEVLKQPLGLFFDEKSATDWLESQ